ncbi:MAG: TenA family protein [Rhodospirillales bacterium]|nr:TenA family protein [Rhodospirillales bacterium]
MSQSSYDAWAAGQVNARFTEWLRQQSEPAWSEATSHRFTRELADGVLADAVMRRYLVQDYSFLDSFVRLVASAIVKAPSLADRVALGRFLGAVSGEENTYFHRAFDALGVPEADRTRPALRPTTRAFHDGMAKAINAEGYEETLAPLVVFEWLYNAWATAVADRQPGTFLHQEWITIHANPQFDAFVAWLRGQLDRSGPTLSRDRQEHIAEVFRRTVRLEKLFFDDAHEGS